MKDDGLFQDKQKQNRIEDFTEVGDLMDHLREESEEGQKQRKRIKDYIEVEHINEHMKDRSNEEELNQQMTERPPRKVYGLKS